MDVQLNISAHHDRMTFEHFPPEIIILIFNHLTGDEILRSFAHLNIRFNSLAKNFHLNTIDFSNWSRTEITHFFKHSYDILSPYSPSLKLTNKMWYDDSCSANIEFIFSSLLDSYQLKHLFENLQQLILMRPIIDIAICLPDIILRSFMIYSMTDKIIFKKSISSRTVMVCSDEMMRSSLVDHGGVYNRVLVNFQNPVIDSIIPSVRHLILHIDNYNEQWTRMSSFITDRITELTILIIDNQFAQYDGQAFSSLIQKISNHCHLHFYLQVGRNLAMTRAYLDLLFQSFQNNFYTQHQSNVIIASGQNSRFTNVDFLLIYTAPFCASKFTLIDAHETFGVCSDYNNITRLIVDPCIPDTISLFRPTTQPLTNQLNFLPNLTSLEFIHIPWHRHYQMIPPWHLSTPHLTARVRHIHFLSVECSRYLTENLFPVYSFDSLRYLDITDNDVNCSMLSNILQQDKFGTNVRHLNISGLCRLQTNHIVDISIRFRELQTLKFPMKFNSSFNDQLNTISQCILINSRNHLHYLHVYFEQENLSINSVIPSENQLSEWLGHNHHRLLHLHAIELTRNELSAWL